MKEILTKTGRVALFALIVLLTLITLVVVTFNPFYYKKLFKKNKALSKVPGHKLYA